MSFEGFALTLGAVLFLRFFSLCLRDTVQKLVWLVEVLEPCWAQLENLRALS